MNPFIEKQRQRAGEAIAEDLGIEVHDLAAITGGAPDLGSTEADKLHGRRL